MINTILSCAGLSNEVNLFIVHCGEIGDTDICFEVYLCCEYTMTLNKTNEYTLLHRPLIL